MAAIKLNSNSSLATIGNIQTNSAIAGTYQYGDPTKPHAVTQAGALRYGYDANGNLTSVTNPTPDCLSVVRLMHWDSENQLAWLSNGTETISYQYNANGSRIRRFGPSVGTTDYFGKVAEVKDPGGSPVLTKYYYAGDILVARQQGGVKQFYHQDHLDSVRALSDAAGAQVVRYEYAAFGDEIEKVGTSDDTHSFGAHRRDPESGLLYMGARYHDPVLGRFTQPDQAVPEAGDPQSWNRYSFARNNPFNRIDPTGRIDIVASDIADRFDELAAQSSDILSNAVLDNGGFVSVLSATAVQTAIDVGAATVDTLRLGEGVAQGGFGILQDIGRALGVAGGSGAALAKATSGLRAATTVTGGRFTQIASGLSKSDARDLLRAGESGLNDAQISSTLRKLGKGKVDAVGIKRVNQSGDVRLTLERAGAESGSQRLSFQIGPEGETKRLVQTAFDDAGDLVRQRPGEAKNNLFDVKQ